MRVAIIGSRGYPYVYSGYETFVKELAERLIRKNVDVKVYCHKNLFASRPANINGIELIYIPTIETKILSQFIHSFFSILHACCTKTDIILVVNVANGPFGLITKLFKKPALINVDGIEWKRPKWKGLGAKYFYFSAKLATRLYDEIITDAEEMHKIYLKEFQTDSTVIAYGATIRYPENPSVLGTFDLNPFDYYLVVGRLIPDNNADLIIEGFIRSKSKKKLIIVGDVPYKDLYADTVKAKAASNIIFMGYVTNSELLAELYHHCFAYIHGHEFGGTNPALLKALAYGCAVLALNTPFNNEMLANGKHGLFFEKNILSIASVVQQAEKKTDLIDKLRKTSRNGLTEKYNWNHITDQYVTILNKLASKKQNRSK